MPRDYKHDPRSKTYKRATSEAISIALNDIRNGMSFRNASLKHEIHYSVLYRHFKNPNMKKQGGQPVLTEHEETAIVNSLITCAEWGYPLGPTDLKMIVKSYLDDQGKVVKKFKNNLPGSDFVYCFLKRHKNTLRARMCQNIKRQRAAVSPEIIDSYFDHLTETLRDVPPSNIINYDETNLCDDPGRKKVIVKRGCRYPERVCNSSKSSTSIMFAVTGDGEVLPPYVVYKAEHLYESWTVGGVKGARYNRSKSGWFDAASFGDWVRNIAIPKLKNLPGKKILIGDNLSSHFSPDIVEECLRYNISFVFLPANSTHLTQPLDVAFFRPLKAIWRKILDEWKMTGDGRKSASIPKDRFPHFLKKLMIELEKNKKNNIQSGFRKCGIIPLDRSQVLNVLPKEKNHEHSQGDVENAVVNLLKSLRYCDAAQPRQKRKKISVQPGQSVMGHSTNEDDSEISDEDVENNDNIEAESIENLEDSNDSEEDMNIPLAKICSRTSLVETKKQNGNVEATSVSYLGNTFKNVVPVSKDSIQKGDWLIVAFPVSFGKIRKNKYFIGNVLDIGESDLEGTFLKHRPSKQFSGHLFEYPAVPDVSIFTFEQVVGKVFPLDECAGTSKREILRFGISQTELN